MAFQDPGSVRWFQRPEYTTTLFQLISNPTNLTRIEAKLLFNKTSRTNAARMNKVAQITNLLFDCSAAAGADQQVREHKLMESLNRRFNVLGAEYTADIRYLNGASGYQPASRKLEYLQNLRATKPYFNSLRTILIDHAAYPEWNEQTLMDAVRAEVEAEAQALMDGGDEADEDEERYYDDMYGGDLGLDDENDDENEEDVDEDGIEMAQPQPQVHPHPQPQHQHHLQQQQQQQQQHQYIPEDTSLCPKCSAPLPLDSESSTSHIKKCFEGDVSTEQTLSCCICEVVFTAQHEGNGTEKEKETKRREHVDKCFKDGLKGFGSTSNAGDGVKKVRWVDYICDSGNVPRDSECSICFEPFIPGELLTRLLDCACIFHQAGLKKWYKSKLSSKRNPQGGMEVDEGKVEEMEGRCPLHSH